MDHSTDYHTLHAAIETHLRRSVQLAQSLGSLVALLAQATMLLRHTLEAGHKVLLCGNGGSAAMAGHLAAELLGRYRVARPGLPAVVLNDSPATLTALANDFGYEQVFARQLAALGHRGDLLLTMSCSGRSANILAAIREAGRRGLAVMAMTGSDTAVLQPLLHDGDLLLAVAAADAAHIQELHLMMLHAIMSGLETGYPDSPHGQHDHDHASPGL